MQQDTGVDWRNGPKVFAPTEELNDRWSARRMIVVVSAICLLAWAALIVSLFGL